MKHVAFCFTPILLAALFLLIGSNSQHRATAQVKSERVLIVKGSGRIVGTNKTWIFIPFDLTDYQSGHYNIIVSLKAGTGISRTGGKCGANFTWSEVGKFPNEILTPKILPMPAGQGYNLGGDFNKPTSYAIALQASCDFEPHLENEYTYEVYLERGKKSSQTFLLSNQVDAPCQDDQVQVNYDRRTASYHDYKLETEVCSTNTPGCTLNLVFSIMTSQIRYIVPATDSTTKVTDCMTFDADIPGPFNEDPIRIVVDSHNYSVTNYTRKGHVFYPGKVTRTVLKKGTSIYVQTYGEGNGRMSSINKDLAPPYWKAVDNKLAKAVKSKLSAR